MALARPGTDRPHRAGSGRAIRTSRHRTTAITARAVTIDGIVVSRAVLACSACWLAARRRHWRPAGCPRHQARNISRPLPVRHALGPHQRISSDRVSGDEIEKLSFRKWALLLALGSIEPGSVGHLISLRRCGRTCQRINCILVNYPGPFAEGPCENIRLSSRNGPWSPFFGWTAKLFVPFEKKAARLVNAGHAGAQNRA
jgi:hypothetical protein